MFTKFRVRLVDEPEGVAHQIVIADVKSSSDIRRPNPTPLTPEQYEKNICRERKILVKAALQLLESHEQEAHANFLQCDDSEIDSKFDVIRSGFLRKGTKTVPMPTLGMSSSKSYSIGGFTWKSKYAELRHGQLIYYGDANEELPLAVSSQHSHHYHYSRSEHEANHTNSRSLRSSSSASDRKVIELNAENCSCRVLEPPDSSSTGSSHSRPHWPRHGSSHSHDAEHNHVHHNNGQPSHHADTTHTGAPPTPVAASDKCIFELQILGGSKRLFMANSAQECEAWVSAIHAAMTGRSGVAPLQHSLDGTAAGGDQHALLAAGTDNQDVAVNARRPSLGSQQHSDEVCWSSKEGAAGPHAKIIADYLSWQQQLHSASAEEDFKRRIRRLVEDKVQVTVPVAFVKGKCADSRFGRAAAGTAVRRNSRSDTNLADAQNAQRGLFSAKRWVSSTHRKKHERKLSITEQQGNRVMLGGVCVEKSQMWKDLQRDEVCVDGESVCGTSGSVFAASAEAAVPVGDQVGGAEAIVGVLVRHLADAADTAKTQLVRILMQRATTHPSIEVIQESQILQCARNILMMCNRTQSGGDTYYCIDSLLNAGLRNDLFTLAPVSNKAEPLEIWIDLVETDRAAFFQGKASVREGQTREAPAAHNDFIEAIVASSSSATNSSPPANTGALGFARRTDLEVLTEGLDRHIPTIPRKSPRSNGQSPRNGATSTSSSPRAVGASSGANGVVRNGGKKLSSVSPTSAKSSEGGDNTSTRSRGFSRGGEMGTSMIVETGSDKDSRRASRRGQLTLHIEDEFSNCDTDASPQQVLSVCSPTAGDGFPATPCSLHDDLVNILESSCGLDLSSDECNNSSATGCDADDEHTAEARLRGAGIAYSEPVPVSVICLSEEESDEAVIDAQNSPGGARVATKDDSTVISDITFDTTAAFSLSTTQASYHKHDPPSTPAVHAEDAAHPQKANHPSAKASKLIMNMFSSRRTPRPHEAPQSSHTPTAADAGSSPMAASPAFTGRVRRQLLGGTPVATPRTRGGVATTLLSAEPKGPTAAADTGHRLGSLLTGTSKKSIPTGRKLSEPDSVVRYTSADHNLDDVGGDPEPYQPCLCLRIQVKGVSRYRVCTGDPQGIPEEDNWATMVGTFQQTFLVPACAASSAPHAAKAERCGEGPPSLSRCRLAHTDRVVTIAAVTYESETPQLN